MPRADNLQRMTKAVELHSSGVSYDDIATTLGYANRSRGLEGRAEGP